MVMILRVASKFGTEHETDRSDHPTVVEYARG